MKKESSIFLEDILKNIELLERFVKNMDKEQYLADTKTQYSVIRGIEIMGEATKNLPRDIILKHPEVPWKDIAGMRDKMIHGYFGVDAKEVWLVVQNDLPDLKKKIARVLEEVEK